MNFVRILQTPAAIVDHDGSVREVNAAWSDIAGASAKNFLQLVADSDQSSMVECLRVLALRQCPAPFEARLAHGRWAKIHFQPFDPVPRGLWLCIATDIHDLKSKYDELSDQNRLQADLLDVSGDCIKLIDASGHLVFMNEAGCRALNVDPASGFGQVWLDRLPPEVRPIGEEALAKVRAGETARFAGRSQLPGGPVEVWDNLLTPMLADDGTLTSILCVSRNVSEEHAAREALRESQERLAMATTVGGLGIWDFDLTTDHLFCDDTWHRIMGRDPANPVTSMDEFKPMIHPEDQETATEVPATAAQLLESGEDYSIAFRVVHPDGEVRWVRSAACLLQDDKGEPTRAIGFVIDITDSRRGQLALQEANEILEQERAILEQQSLEDPLTRLPNRRALATELDRIASNLGRSSESVSVVMIDLDFFKLYNDHYGHVEGDAVLVRFSDFLADIARRTDFVARYGGEEFVLILTNTQAPDLVLQRLFDTLAEAAIPHPESSFGRVTISAGCAIFDSGSTPEPEDMIKAADQALYEAKSAGRNRFIVS